MEELFWPGAAILVVFLEGYIQKKRRAMLRKELLDARRALRSAREGVSGPRSKKQRGEWELASIQKKKPMHFGSRKWVRLGFFYKFKYEKDHTVG